MRPSLSYKAGPLQHSLEVELHHMGDRGVSSGVVYSHHGVPYVATSQ